MKKYVLCLGLLACIVSSCTSEKDVFDPNYNKELGVVVPEGFEWSTTQSVTVNVAVNDEYNGKYYYAVRVYDKAPAQGVLPIAASGEVTGEMPFSQKIVIPATVAKLYISQVFKKADASEVVTTKEVAINGAVIDCSFGIGRVVHGVTSRGGDKIILSSGQTISGSGKYKIPANVTITQDKVTASLEDVDIEIEGTLRINGAAKLHEWEISIETNGILEVQGDLELVGNKNNDDKSSSIENEGYVHITGNLKVNAGASLDNDDNDDGVYRGGCLIVDGEAHFQSNKIELDERSYMSCGSLKLGASDMKIYMETGAWLRVLGNLTSAENCEIGFGDYDDDDSGFSKPDTDDKIIGTDYVALVQVGNWGNNGKGNLTTRKEILVECKNGKGKNNILSLTTDASKEITIVGTTCSGSIGDEEETELGEYTYIMEDQYPNQGDYDMNDVVVVIKAVQTGNTLSLEGTLRAAGATKKIIPYVMVNGDTKPLFENGKDVHAVFNVADNVMVNTTEDGSLLPAKEFSLTFDGISQPLSMDDIDFYIQVDNNEIHWNTRKDNAVWGMRIPKANFAYPIESINIMKAYPRFSEWFGDPKSDWYNYPGKEIKGI